MNQSSYIDGTKYFLVIAVAMMTCLILLINASFKIIELKGLVFTASSLLCPIFTALYLVALRCCTLKEQRHLLNNCLISLYVFCLGVYVLVNLPPAEYMHGNAAYQIVFEDIPKKFFATTIAFVLSYYVPHALIYCKSAESESSAKQAVLLSMFGGIAFFVMNYFFLFSSMSAKYYHQIFLDSLMISMLFLLLISVIHLGYLLKERNSQRGSGIVHKSKDTFPVYPYLVSFAVAILLISLVCEYRLVSFGKDSILAASAIFFPVTLMISTIIGELWGYQANIRLTMVLIFAQFIFDAFLMGISALPSPSFSNLTTFYSYILPRRLPAASLALLVTFISNAMLLHYLQQQNRWSVHRSLRIVIANCCANSLLCLVNYTILFAGIYPYEQIFNLAINVWQYKLLVTFVSFPFILWMCSLLERNHRMVYNA